jgi:predicted MFS family arabinose efflux permease
MSLPTAEPASARQVPPAVPIVLAGFTAFLGLYATQPLLPLLVRVFDTSEFAVSLTVTAPTIAVALVAPAIGRLADIVGRRRVIVGSAFVLAVATLLAASSTSLLHLVTWRFAQGLATPGIFAGTIAYIHDQWPGAFVGRATSAYVSGTVVGGFSGRALMGLVAARAGWQVAFVCLAVVNLAAALALARTLPYDRRDQRSESEGSPAAPAAVIRNPQLVATNAVGFCVLFTQVAMFTYVTFHLEAPPFGLTTAALGWLFAVYLFGAAVTPLAGRWIDARGHRAGLASGVGVGALGSMLTLAPRLPLVVAGLALVATGVFIAQATTSSYIGAVTQQNRGLAVGLYSTFYYAGGSLGGALPALVWDRAGWAGCVLLVIAVQAATLLIAQLSWRDVSRPGPPLAGD